MSVNIQDIKNLYKSINEKTHYINERVKEIEDLLFECDGFNRFEYTLPYQDPQDKDFTYSFIWDNGGAGKKGLKLCVSYPNKQATRYLVRGLSLHDRILFSKYLDAFLEAVYNNIKEKFSHILDN